MIFSLHCKSLVFRHHPFPLLLSRTAAAYQGHPHSELFPSLSLLQAAFRGSGQSDGPFALPVPDKAKQLFLSQIEEAGFPHGPANIHVSRQR